ncbi:hypothetical protein NDU88_011801 [Pleurodeles waltl]|uniref:Uncharacterized protein n=1 Tax=Pleurodeles waltl TaxID=8319 RepID=A0AAV7QZT6_PLEWA|nr:hypothetical protein NDU88_011801 [Pleurodeles waltl]
MGSKAERAPDCFLQCKLLLGPSALVKDSGRYRHPAGTPARHPIPPCRCQALLRDIPFFHVGARHSCETSHSSMSVPGTPARHPILPCRCQALLRDIPFFHVGARHSCETSHSSMSVPFVVVSHPDTKVKKVFCHETWRISTNMHSLAVVRAFQCMTYA